MLCIDSLICLQLKTRSEPHFQPLFSVAPQLIFKTEALYYLWSPFVNHSLSSSLKHCLFSPQDWIPAPLVTLRCRPLVPYSILGGLYVCQGGDGVCLHADSPVGLRSPPSSGLYYLHLFPVSEPQLRQNNSGALGGKHQPDLGVAAQPTQPPSLLSAVLKLAALHFTQTRSPNVGTKSLINLFLSFHLSASSTFAVPCCHFLLPSSGPHSSFSCCSPPPPSSSSSSSSSSSITF